MSGPDLQFSWRRLQASEAGLAHGVHLLAIADQAFGLVRPDELPHFVAHTDAGGQAGVIIGCFCHAAAITAGLAGKMVAYGVLGMNSATSAHMADLLNVPPSANGRFAILDGVACLPAWRGYGLHRDSIQARLTHAHSLGRTLIGATVSPENTVSLRGLMEAGFLVTNFAMMYGGLARFILQKNLELPAAAWSLEQKIDTCNRSAHQAALALGLSAFACGQAGSGNWQLHYGYRI